MPEFIFSGFREVSRGGSVSCRCAAALFAVLLWMPSGQAQQKSDPVDLLATSPAGSGASELSLESLAARRESLENSTSLTDDQKATAIESLAAAIQALQEEQSSIERLRALKASTEDVVSKLEATRAELESPTQDVVRPTAEVDLPTAQQRLAAFEEQLRTAEARKADLDAQDSMRTRRRTEAPAELSKAKAELEALAADKGPLAEQLHPEVQAANTAQRQAKRRALTARIAFLERELPAYDATAPLLSAERSLAARKVTVGRKAVEMWQGYVNSQRLSEAEAYAREAAEVAQKASPAALEFAQQLSTLASELVSVRSRIAQDIAATNKLIARTEQPIDQLKSDFEEIKARADAAGFTNSVGVLLREHQSSLPDQNRLSRDIADRQNQIADTHIQRLNYQNQRAVVADVEGAAEQLAQRVGAGQSAEQQNALRNELRTIFQARARYLDGVIADLSSYLDRLATLDVAQRTLLQQTSDQSAYIAEHILWVRSATAIDASTASQAWVAVTQLKSDLQEVTTALRSDIIEEPQFWLFAVVALVGLLVIRNPIRAQIIALGHLAERKVTTELRPTVVALGLTLLISSIWPLLLLFVGWRLNSQRSQAGLISATGFACQATAVLVFSLDFLRHVCRPNGLGVAHFQWPARAVDGVRETVRMVLFVAVPVVSFSFIMWRSQDELYQPSLGRLSLILAMLTLATAMHRALRSGSPIIEESVTLAPSGWVTRTRYLWYAIGVGLPVILSLLAAAGYLYTARQLSLRLGETGWLLLVIVLIACLVNRWQLLTYRRLAMKQARERRALLLQEKEKAGEEEDAAIALQTEDSVETLSESNVRLGKLFSALFASAVVLGLGLIWSDVLPAFGVLSNIPLWQSNVASEIIDGVTEYEWITLRDLCVTVLLLALTFFAATNIPALLEFAVLPRLPFDSGTRYAISTVVRYLITVVGLVLAFSLLGFGWENIQWLVAAMTVGLGFGLQEIFANFVSGLILLFERPIRIGDTVTVGDVTGTVTRIRIRATTIVDWDRKELVVPNREFVTGQLVNWTLSDALLRVVVQVGIAYGSDTRLATKLLYKVAEDNPDVLEEPPPRVIFTAFGASSLDFELRCFVSSPQQYRIIRHELNLEIDDVFRQNNIEIAFPQQDLHIRSVEGPIASAAFTGRRV